MACGTMLVMISFIVPAHNEELLIGRTLMALHRAARAVGKPYEIIVVNDASTDRTEAIAVQSDARVIGVNLRQIAAARNAGARAARIQWADGVLVFVDADTIVPEHTLCVALDALNRGAVGGGATIQFDGTVPRWASIMLTVFLALFRLLGLAGGCFVFCKRKVFEKAGGWDESVYASEELLMARAIKRHGRFVVLREHVITSGRKVRAYSAREILGTLAHIGFHGRRAVTDRTRLGLWYGPRRNDPASTNAQLDRNRGRRRSC